MPLRNKTHKNTGYLKSGKVPPPLSPSPIPQSLTSPIGITRNEKIRRRVSLHGIHTTILQKYT